jgi:phenylacetate-coenzyme A ligase PaaK-like adenylate-forming protein
MVKSRLARRHILPKDIWSLKGIIGSGIDSWVYKDKIKELWGKNPLDLYSCTEGGVIATQTWDYEGMTFIPNLNFLEFISEEEQLKSQMDRSYRPATLLLNEVKAGETYEVVLTSFHGGAMVRYRIGDVVKITSLKNEKLGIDIPQMAFERRVDGVLDFFVVRLTEKTIWQAIEQTGVPYEDWTAYREPGDLVLRLFIEPKNDAKVNEEELAGIIYKQIMETSDEKADLLGNDMVDSVGFKVQVGLLAPGTFARYMSLRQDEGADLAHLKPPHISPSEETLSILVAKPEKAGLAIKTEVDSKEITV